MLRLIEICSHCNGALGDKVTMAIKGVSQLENFFAWYALLGRVDVRVQCQVRFLLRHRVRPVGRALDEAYAVCGFVSDWFSSVQRVLECNWCGHVYQALRKRMFSM